MPNADHDGGGSVRGERAGASKGDKTGGKGEKTSAEKNAGRKDGSAGRDPKAGGGKSEINEKRGGGDVDKGSRDKPGRDSGGNKGSGAKEKSEAKQQSGERVGKGRTSEGNRTVGRTEKAGPTATGRQPADTRTGRSPSQERKTSAQPDRTQGAKKQAEAAKDLAAKSNRVKEYAGLSKAKRDSSLEQTKLANDLGVKSLEIKTRKDGATVVKTTDGKGHETNYTVSRDGFVEVHEVDPRTGDAKRSIVRGDRVRALPDVMGRPIDPSANKGQRANLTFFDGLDFTSGKGKGKASTPSDKPSNPPRESPVKPISEPKTIGRKPEREPRDGRSADLKDRPEKRTTSPAFVEPKSIKTPSGVVDNELPERFGRGKQPRPERSMPMLRRPISNASGEPDFRSSGNSDATLELLFQGSELIIVIDQGKRVRGWPAVAGRPGSTSLDQGKPDFGPIPEGYYSVFPEQTQYFDPLNLRHLAGWVGLGPWKGGPPAWGTSRTPIVANPGTNMLGRSKMFLHGGWDPGSRGCIDLTVYNDDFHDWLRAYGKPILLRVVYPKPVF